MKDSNENIAPSASDAVPGPALVDQWPTDHKHIRMPDGWSPDVIDGSSVPTGTITQGLLPAGEKTEAELIGEANSHWRKGCQLQAAGAVEWVLAGVAIKQATAGIKRGGVGEFYEKLEMPPTTAKKLRKLAEHKPLVALAEANQQLPSNPSVLHEMTLLSADEWNRAQESGAFAVNATRSSISEFRDSAVDRKAEREAAKRQRGEADAALDAAPVGEKQAELARLQELESDFNEGQAELESTRKMLAERESVLKREQQIFKEERAEAAEKLTSAEELPDFLAALGPDAEALLRDHFFAEFEAADRARKAATARARRAKKKAESK